MGNWQLDPLHTQVEFAAKHLGMMTVRGHFADVTSTADIDPDHLERMRVEVTIQAASIKTHNQIRDNDLRSSNFLETDAFPVITFTSTRVEAAGEDRYIVTGDLTIKGNTRPVALQMTKLGEFNDPRMGHRIGYSGHATINRKDFGMSFNAMLDGRFVVSDDINIMLEGELVEQPEQSQQAEQTEPAGPTTDD
ncbi:MAG TPA: YceI family protein [Propionibacteriaceae bacterium]|nr:YceI family protein [Propionibacteriaceae bacterium]